MMSPPPSPPSSNTPCAACKCMRRRCTEECVFAPYFPPENFEKFMNVHRAYGASNFAKILRELDPSEREEAANTLCFEASLRNKNPIYGCVGWIEILQQRIGQVQRDIDSAMRELSNYVSPSDLSLLLNALGKQCCGPTFEMTQTYDNVNNQVTMAMGNENNNDDNTSHQQQQILEQIAALREQEMSRSLEQLRFQEHEPVRNISSNNNGGLYNTNVAMEFDGMTLMQSPSLGMRSANYDHQTLMNQLQQYDQPLLLLEQEINNSGNYVQNQKLLSAHKQQQVNNHSAGLNIHNHQLLSANEQQRLRSYPQIQQQRSNLHMQQERSHPQTQQQERSHPQVERQRRSHPQIEQQQRSHPQIELQSTHPEVEQQRRSHPQIEQQRRSHPQIEQQQRSHPQIERQSRLHPQVEQKRRSHPQIEQQQRSHPQIERQSRLHPQIEHNQRLHPQTLTMQQRSQPQIERQSRLHPQTKQQRSHPQIQQQANGTE